MNDEDKITNRTFFDTKREAMEYAHKSGGQWDCFHNGPYWVDEFVKHTPTPKTTRPIDVVSKQYVKHLEERIDALTKMVAGIHGYLSNNKDHNHTEFYKLLDAYRNSN